MLRGIDELDPADQIQLELALLIRLFMNEAKQMLSPAQLARFKPSTAMFLGWIEFRAQAHAEEGEEEHEAPKAAKPPIDTSSVAETLRKAGFF